MSFEDEWRRCARFLEPALDEGWTLERLKAECAQGRAALWPGRRSAAVSELNTRFHIWAAGGELDELLAMERAAEAHARAWGCDQMSLDGRKGWARVLAPKGYRRIEMLVKDL